MKPRTNVDRRAQQAKGIQGEGPNWILILGGALLSTLSIRFGWKLKQAFSPKQRENINNLEGIGRSTDSRRSPSWRMHSNRSSFAQDDDGCINYMLGTEAIAVIKKLPNEQLLSGSDDLPLVTVPNPEFGKENGVTWVSTLDRLELPCRPFHHSNCSDSPCVSESGSDIFSKREVIQRLRQQLKRRDDMIMEMQEQIGDLQNSLNAQLILSLNLKAQLDAAHRDLFDSEGEIQRLRKAIADHVGADDKSSMVTMGASEELNGHSNGFVDANSNLQSPKQGKGDGKRIEMLKRELGELKEVIEGKEYLLQNYKEQKAELSTKIKELQQRLDSQLPNIL